MNFANITTAFAGEANGNHTLTTFNAGIFSGFSISKVFDLKSGLMAKGKGAKSET